MTRRGRAVAAVAAAGLAVLLATAGGLVPDDRGHGTHQQLGLPPCSFRTVFGLRCPTCGMTTSWAALVRGQIGPALQANAVGTMLGAGAMVGMVWLAASAIRGRWFGGTPHATGTAWAMIAVVLIVMIEWGVRLTIQLAGP